MLGAALNPCGWCGAARAELLFFSLPQMKTMSCTDSKVEQMFQILLDPQEKDADKKQKV